MDLKPEFKFVRADMARTILASGGGLPIKSSSDLNAGLRTVLLKYDVALRPVPRTLDQIRAKPAESRSEPSQRSCRRDYRDAQGHGPHECPRAYGHSGPCGS